MEVLPHAKISPQIKAVWLNGVGFKILLKKTTNQHILGSSYLNPFKQDS